MAGSLTQKDALAVEMRPTEAVTPYPSNPRKAPPKAVDAVARSIERFGWRQPIVVDASGVVIVGHTRLLAARKLGLAQVPVHVADMPESEARAYRVADNQTGFLTSWDDDLLTQELLAIKDDGIDLDVLAFKEGEIARLLAEPVVEDEVPEPPADPVTKPGDLWVLGEHRLLCGDSTRAEDVARVLGGVVPFIMVTDPPYGVEYDPEWRLRAGLNKEHQTRAEGVVENDACVDWTNAYKSFPGHVAYVWHAGRFAADLVVNLRDAGFEIRTQVIWRKTSLVIGRGHYHWQHEPCWYAVRKGGSAKWCGDRTQSTVWDIPNMHRTQGSVDDGKTNHSTQKPVECMARPIRNHGGPDDHVYDPFVGSGTTIIAAEQLGRRCYAIELSPAYVDVCVQRWEKLTGGKAELEAADG